MFVNIINTNTAIYLYQLAFFENFIFKDKISKLDIEFYHNIYPLFISRE